MSEELCRKLGYRFNNPKILKTALTHCSSDDNNNERLEFLGDSIVNFIIAEALYQQFSQANEGNLSRWRATLINREALGNLAREFKLGRYLFLGPGELKSGGGERLSILSCAMEAVIGGIYLDGGFAAARECILRWYAPSLESLSFSTNLKHPKTKLQEHLQGLHLSLPSYKVDSAEGESHQQVFMISCSVEGKKTIGKGTSRRRAEQEAAELMLGIIQNEYK